MLLAGLVAVVSCEFVCLHGFDLLVWLLGCFTYCDYFVLCFILPRLIIVSFLFALLVFWFMVVWFAFNLRLTGYTCSFTSFVGC